MGKEAAVAGTTGGAAGGASSVGALTGATGTAPSLSLGGATPALQLAGGAATPAGLTVAGGTGGSASMLGGAMDAITKMGGGSGKQTDGGLASLLKLVTKFASATDPGSSGLTQTAKEIFSSGNDYAGSPSKGLGGGIADGASSVLPGNAGKATAQGGQMTQNLLENAAKAPDSPSFVDYAKQALGFLTGEGNNPTMSGTWKTGMQASQAGGAKPQQPTPPYQPAAIPEMGGGGGDDIMNALDTLLASFSQGYNQGRNMQ